MNARAHLGVSLLLALHLGCAKGGQDVVAQPSGGTATPSGRASTPPPADDASTPPTSGSAATPTSTAPTAVVWHGGGGWWTLTIDRDGAATYDFHPTGWGSQNQKPVKTRLVLSRADLDKLVDTLRRHQACSLRASGRLPVPEEHSQELTLDLPGLSCTVSMLSNDWSQGPHSQPIAQALDEIAERVRRDGK